MKKEKDLIYEYEIKIAKAKRSNDTEAQYYYQDKLNELLRGKGEWYDYKR